ncbi:hypothetical protein K449DRAFT_386486 [Hypoxylon sp. EC38]|nr:hypothetical protein K449DRAFT_386486 [Hypoxylon sp. EC38]
MGMRIDTMLSNFSQRLRAILESDEPGEDDIVMTDAEESGSEMEDMDSSDADISFEEAEDDYDNLFDIDPIPARQHDSSSSPTVPISPLTLNRIRRDLLSAHQAGFHTGKASGFGDEGFDNVISISLRIRKLGLSKETREAWYLAPSDYIVLLIRYERDYITFDDIMKTELTKCKINFRLIRCSKKKPSHQQANAAFSSSLAENTSKKAQEDPELSDIWISRSIDDLLNNEFLPISKLRKINGYSWDAAKERLYSVMSSSIDSSGESPRHETMDYAADQGKPSNEEQSYKTKLPSFLTADHLSEDGELSLPLIAMQFALLYLVRCTDYCTACHRKVKSNIEALRPYVCSEPLCLHQYMSLGLGPSIDYEIVNQPNVVDLLVSFCYASLYTRASSTDGGIREFPTGLGLQVPKIRKLDDRTPDDKLYLNSEKHRYVKTTDALLIDPLEVDFDWNNSAAKIVSNPNNVDLEVGQWIVVSTNVPNKSATAYPPSQTVLHHARVVSNISNSLHLNVVSQHIIPTFRDLFNINVGTIREWVGRKSIRGHIVTYDDDLDELRDEYQKAFSMMVVLASLPSVAEMRTYLMSNQLQQLALAKWNKMSRASVNLLRWIISSNRSYIVQVSEEQTDPLRREKIHGVNGWLQFRFAQGSPEKEGLFRQALEPIETQQKTLLAWHGSGLDNWHSIIRQGLDFSRTLHGRAYGDGIYFSRAFDYSIAYTSHLGKVNTAQIWPPSSLRIQAAISLSELVNSPNEFVSSNPFFVVQKCHWTQCRYLFVRSMGESKPAPGTNITPTTPKVVSTAGVPEFVQDPRWVATGAGGSKLFVPKYAFPSARDGRDDATKSLKNELGEPEIVSSDEDEEDVKFLFPQKAVQAIQTYETDFRPGTLDLSTLPQLAPPSYATEISQKALGQEIRKLQKMQSTTQPHLLGWYINFEEIRNMFQWIVELHSFEQTLPLAVDMKKAGLTSIVLEIRFLRGFPMSPPFVRVIRPRFLPFIQGGGGHVTAGGALCMELLTNSGWSPANSMESVLLQVRMAISSVDPQPARLEGTTYTQRDYGIGEAVEAYKRAAANHGWELPGDLLDASLNA